MLVNPEFLGIIHVAAVDYALEFEGHVVLFEGKWIVQGDLSIFTRTVSNYGDCRLLHLPNVRLSLGIAWKTLGNPNAHHDVMPCAPEKVPDFSHGVSYFIPYYLNIFWYTQTYYTLGKQKVTV